MSTPEAAFDCVAEALLAELSIGRRTMREWVAVEVEREPEWLALAREALAFVRSG